MMNYRKHHKWFGIVFCFFLLMFAISGIVLNHRHMYGSVNVSRSYLPISYHFRNWNNGLLRGTLRIGKDSVLIYGAGGAFLTDNEAKTFEEFNQGMPIAADSRALRNVVQTERGNLFAVAQFDSYILRDGRWECLPIGMGTAKHNDIRFSDIDVDCETLADIRYRHATGTEIRDIVFSNVRGTAKKPNEIEDGLKGIVFDACQVRVEANAKVFDK